MNVTSFIRVFPQNDLIDSNKIKVLSFDQNHKSMYPVNNDGNINPKTIRGYKATPHKIVRNIDGEWYESRPTKEIWPAGSDVPDVNGEYDGGYDCAYRWFPIGKDYPKGEWYELKPHFYGWEIDLKPGQKPLSAYYWHIGEPEPTFQEYKHVDGILKHVKTTYKELPF